VTEAAVPLDTGDLQRELGHDFADPSLLVTALRHSSYSHEHDGEPSNERLEFLGDAVIGLVVSTLLFEAHPDWTEGDLTRGLHGLVDRRSLARAGQEMGLGGYLLLGRTEVQSQGSGKATIVGNAMEAVIGALYLDGGLPAVRRLAQQLFGEALLPEAPRAPRDAKTLFQERVMGEYGEFPIYEVVSDSGLANDDERFGVLARVQGEDWSSGHGRSKRRAEHAAAEAGLIRMGASDE
jgi:ribonuclease-3